MRYDPPDFRAWQEAEHLACEADRKLFAKLCFCGGAEVPTATEVAEARALRQRAGRLMKNMLDEMRELAVPQVQQRAHAP